VPEPQGDNRSVDASVDTGNERCSKPANAPRAEGRGEGNSAWFAKAVFRDHRGIGRPVSSGGMNPSDSGDPVKVEHVGKDRCWHPGGEMNHGGAPAWSGVDPEVPQALAEVPVAERSPGQGGQGRATGLWRGPCAQVTAASGHEAGDEAAERLGQWQAVVAEAELDLVAASYDLVGGDGDDAAELLAVEQDETTSDPVCQLELSSWRSRLAISQRASSSSALPSSRGRRGTSSATVV